MYQIEVLDRKEATIFADGLDKDAILSVCCSIFQQFSWKLLQAGENKMLAVTAPEWNKKPQHITITAADGLLTVSSEFAGEELMDVVGRNRRNVDQFLAAFQATKNSLPPHVHQTNKQIINDLRAQAPMAPQLYKARELQQTETVELKEVLKNDSEKLYTTYTLIALNIFVFVLMALNGAGIIWPNGMVHLRWGSNFAPLTMGGDWWRLLSSSFIHFGVLHLAIDIYCLYWLGTYLEPLLGRARYVTAYLCTAVLAGIASIWWYSPPINSAGAGGAILGLDGILLSFLIARLLPEALAKKLRRGLGLFILVNLLLGLTRLIDSAALAGGLVSGLIIGYIFTLDLKNEKHGQKAAWVLPVIFSVTAIVALLFVQNFHGNPESLPAIRKKTSSGRYADEEKFNSAYQQFTTLGQKGLDVYNDNTITEAQRVTDLRSISFTEWDSAGDIAREMKGYKVSPQMQQLAATLEQYAQLRKEEIALYAEMVEKNSGPQKLEAIRSKMKTITDSFK